MLIKVNLDQTELITQAKKGKQQAFNILLEKHWDYVYNYLKSLINDEFMVEEICIQTFERAFDKINQYDKKYTFKTWLTTIGKNLWIDQKRKKEIVTSQIGQNENTLVGTACANDNDRELAPRGICAPT